MSGIETLCTGPGRGRHHLLGGDRLLKRLGPAFQVLKTALAAALAWQLATYISGSHSPYFAPLAVILTLQATVADTLERALFRVSGMVGGVIVSMMIHYWLPTNALAIGLALLAGMAIAMLIRLNPQITSQIGVTSLMVLVSKDTTHYATDRVLETGLGALVAIGVNALVIPPDLTPLAEKRITDLTDLLAGTLSDLAHGVQEPGDAMPRAIAELTVDAREALRSARQSIKYNPFMGRRGARLDQLALVVGNLEKMAIQVRGIIRGISDLGHNEDAGKAGLDGALLTTASCVAAFGVYAVDPTAEHRTGLDEAVDRAQESQSRCLRYLKEVAPLPALREVGAILTDLDRILGEVNAIR